MRCKGCGTRTTSYLGYCRTCRVFTYAELADAVESVRIAWARRAKAGKSLRLSKRPEKREAALREWKEATDEYDLANAHRNSVVERMRRDRKGKKV